MTRIAWEDAEEFGLLCDLVASNRLVCLTGAGISRGMRRRHAPPGTDPTLPGWVELLRELLAALEARMAPADAAAARRLLDAGREVGETDAAIGSRELILAASLIRSSAPDGFDRRFRAAITEAPGQCGSTHVRLLDLLPRGILTFNYDGGHETACARRGLDYALLNPTDDGCDDDFRQALEQQLDRFFVLKAHGSSDSLRPLVLTTTEYRNLLAKNPSFRAFVQNLFTNFSFVMVGYGLDDPDFDLFVRTMAEQFGAPVQRHVVLRLAAQRRRREEVERHLYGIRTLHLNDFGEIDAVLELAARTAGPELMRTLEDCLSATLAVRQRGHRALERLGPAGRALAGNVLLGRLDDGDSFTVSEAAYSLGVLDVGRYKERLCALVDTRLEADVLGRTLTVLRPALTPDDLPRVKRWRGRRET
jgi:hypothetical protein